MAILVASETFKGSLLQLLGQTEQEVRAGKPTPYLQMEGPNAVRYVWADSARDEKRDCQFPILYIVRFRLGRAWAVGIKAADYFFGLPPGNEGASGFVMIPKDLSQFDRRMVNWVCKRPDGSLYNHGVSY